MDEFRRGASNQVHKRRPLASSWRPRIAFLLGFCIQFNVLLGGDGEGAAATGGFGYRLFDFICLVLVGLLGLYSLTPRRILSLALYLLIAGALFIGSALSPDPRTAILAYHYFLFSLAALYAVIILSDVAALEKFCWGLIGGLLATVPIFIIQDFNLCIEAGRVGLIPGYSQEAFYGGRYAGLNGHPNEAGHVAALSASAGAYFAFARRRFLPLCLVSAGLLAVFFYTQSRGGLVAAAAIVSIPFLIGRGRINPLRFAVMSAAGLVSIFLLSQVDFIGSRFGDDPNQSDNIAQRLESIKSGLEVVLTRPLGSPIDDFMSYVSAGSGGTTSPHNGFIFFGGVFGLLPLAIFLVACVVNLRVKEDGDIFFTLLTAQISLSFLFEQLPGSYAYAFMMCLLCARAFIKTPVGVVFKPASSSVTGRTTGLPLPRRTSATQK